MMVYRSADSIIAWCVGCCVVGRVNRCKIASIRERLSLR
jgi:hypothetical protein